MYQTVNFHDFQAAFSNMNRGENFSYEGLEALFQYLEFLEEDTGQQTELDVIALCCEYMEIEDDEESYKEYVGENAEREDMVIAQLPTGVLIQQG